MVSRFNQKRLSRILAFVGAVMNHGRALLVTLLGSVIFAIPGWIIPLLSRSSAQKLTSTLAISPQTYRYLAVGVFLVGFLFSSFLAWDEERDTIESHLSELIARNNAPELTFAIRSMNFIPTFHSSKLDVHVNLVILNSGFQTALHSWQASVGLRSGENIHLTEWHFDAEHQYDNSQKRNLFIDEEVIPTGGKREGWIRFALPSNKPLYPLDIRLVSLGCYDTFGEFYEINGPDLGPNKPQIDDGHQT